MLGKTEWFIADGFMSDTKKGDLVSHEAVCVLNLSGKTAHIGLTVYFEDREPLEHFFAECENSRTNHIRLDRIVSADGKKIPKNTPYAVVLKSDVPVICQATRLDVSQPEYALMTTIAY